MRNWILAATAISLSLTASTVRAADSADCFTLGQEAGERVAYARVRAVCEEYEGDWGFFPLDFADWWTHQKLDHWLDVREAKRDRATESCRLGSKSQRETFWKAFEAARGTGLIHAEIDCSKAGEMK